MSPSSPRASSPTALVTGASGGIGRSLAAVLAEHGHSLILTARRAALLEETARDLRARFGVAVHVVPHDLGRPGAAAELYGKIHALDLPVDVLVNNAGFGVQGAFADTDRQQHVRLLSVNVLALTELTHLFLQPMLDRGHGRILNVSSIAAWVPGPLMATYHASKSYVLYLTEALANEVKGTGVTVTCLCPGPTETEFERRSGLTGSKSFAGKLMAPQAVARAGYDAMIRGKSCAVVGFKNKAQLLPTHLIPRSVLAAFARKYSEVDGRRNGRVPDAPSPSVAAAVNGAALGTRVAPPRPRNP